MLIAILVIDRLYAIAHQTPQRKRNRVMLRKLIRARKGKES
jgi:hypothetical protein